MRWDPVHDSRRAFLACLRAFCEPGVAIGGVPRPHLHDDMVLDVASGVLLTVLDPGFGLAIVGDVEAQRLGEILCTLTGAQPAPLERASFVLVVDDAPSPVAAHARRGTALEPERGATVVYAGPWVPFEATLELAGRAGQRRIDLPLPMAERAALAEANAEPPAGIDALVVDGTVLRGLPRSATIVRELA